MVQCPSEEPCSGSCRGDMLHRHLGGVGFPDLIVERLDDSHRNSVKGCSAPSLAEDGSGSVGLPPIRPRNSSQPMPGNRKRTVMPLRVLGEPVFNLGGRPQRSERVRRGLRRSVRWQHQPVPRTEIGIAAAACGTRSGRGCNTAPFRSCADASRRYGPGALPRACGPGLGRIIAMMSFWPGGRPWCRPATISIA